jgi:hypothetical protein
MRGVMCLIMEKAATGPAWESWYIVSDVNKVLQAWKVKLDTVLSESRKSWAGNASSSLFKENIPHGHPILNTFRLFFSYPASYRALLIPLSISFAFDIFKLCVDW